MSDYVLCPKCGKEFQLAPIWSPAEQTYVDCCMACFKEEVSFWSSTLASKACVSTQAGKDKVIDRFVNAARVAPRELPC